MSEVLTVVVENVNAVNVSDDGENVVVVGGTTLVAVDAGRMGPPGPAGVAGPQGPPGIGIVDLAPVATSGSYTDLINKPTIPTVESIDGLIDDSIAEHVQAGEPHPSYDDLPSLTLLFENGLV